MSLIGPILDDRSFEQLRDELVARIRVYAPEWTDHNESDPGIALLELFSFLGESLLFRFNQIPDATKIQFLRLLGVQPRPAQCARVLLALSTEVPGGVQVLRQTEARAGQTPFETDDEVYVWPLEAVGVGKRATDDTTEPGELERRQDALARLKAATPAFDESTATFYETAHVPSDPTAPDAAPLDVAETVDGALWIALLAKETTDLAKLHDRKIVFMGVAMDDAVPRPFDLVDLAHPPGESERYRAGGLDALKARGSPIPAAGAGAVPPPGLGTAPPAMLWRLWNGPPDPAATLGTHRAFTDLRVVGDTTGGLVTTGVVKVELPETLPPLDTLPPSTGGTDSPPPLDDEDEAARVVAWLQVLRPDTENDAIHGVRWLGLNAVTALQAQTADAELLGSGTADAGQRFPLTRRPVLKRTVRLQVEEPDGWRDWQEVDRFTASRPDERQFVVDLTAGAVQFGTRGRVPQIGERIRVLSYRHGGGNAGTVGARALNKIDTPGVEVANPLPSAGGADAAGLDDALTDIPAEVHRRDRAVVPHDFRALALLVPGVRRAEVLPLLHPDAPDETAAGVVSVIVLPKEDLRSPSAPSPDLSLLRRVAAYLDERRLVTTELYVLPPTYRKISVAVGVQVRAGYQVDAVRRWVELIVRQFLAPVPPYGPEGAGWPLGRTVRRAELEAVAVQVDGVEYLEGLRLSQPGATGDSQRIELKRWELPQLVDITVVQGDPLQPGEPHRPAPPPAGGDVVPVPLPPEVC